MPIRPPALDDRSYDDHVAERRALFRAKRQVLLDFFDQVGLTVHGSEATIYLWVHVPAGFDDESWADCLLEQGIVVSPGRMFGVEGAGKGYVRLALVPSLEAIRAATDVLRRVLRG